MISKRLKLTHAPPLVNLGQLASRRVDCISLGQGAPYYAPPDWLFQLYHQHPEFGNRHRYTPDPGLVTLREGIATKLREDQGVNVDSEQIIITPGANQAFFNILMTLTDPGDEVILLSPYYFNHHMACTMANVNPVVVPLGLDFSFDLPAIRAAITDHTRLIVVVNPGNPTGKVHSRQELLGLLNLCQTHKLLIVADETYEYFSYDPSTPHIPLASLGEGVIGISSFSKSFGVPGWRLGYYYGSSDMIEASIKVQDTTVICAPQPSQLLGQLLLEHRQRLLDPIVRAMRENHVLSMKLLAEVEWLEPSASSGSYYLFPRHTTGKPTIDLVKELILEYGVYVVPGAAFGNWEDYLRISFANVLPDTLSDAFTRLSRYYF